MKNKKLIVAIAVVMIIAILGWILLYQTKLFENAKLTVSRFIAGNIENNENPNMKVDITNTINDAYPEHEHVWYDEHDETNHWNKCSVCKEVKGLAKHTLTTTWALGHEGCEDANSYTTTCSCGYGITGRKPCVWNGTWEPLYVGYNYHNRRCVNCNKGIANKPYIDNTKGGILIEDPGNEKYVTGMLDDRFLCKLSDGTIRPCGSSSACSICKGPRFKNSGHNYCAITNNTIKCQVCGNIRWNI